VSVTLRSACKDTANPHYCVLEYLSAHNCTAKLQNGPRGVASSNTMIVIVNTMIVIVNTMTVIVNTMTVIVKEVSHHRARHVCCALLCACKVAVLYMY
jgi:uncharacterized membrane protein YozB (DUF420 family)